MVRQNSVVAHLAQVAVAPGAGALVLDVGEFVIY